MFFNKIDSNDKKPFTLYTYDEAKIINDFMFSENLECWKECKRINKNDLNRKTRLKKRINKIISSDSKSYFITLTFTDQVLQNTNYDSRRQYVRRYLNDISLDFVANIDYGEQNGREHYHAVVNLKSALNGAKTPKKWQYGYMSAKIINKNLKKNDVRLSKYLSKLTNHAIKQSTFGTKIIYSRCKVV